MKRKAMAALAMTMALLLSACGESAPNDVDPHDFAPGQMATSDATSTYDAVEYSTGEIVTFGAYEQDNDIGNGPEPIEWVVVGKRDGHTMLLSKYALDSMPYNSTRASITWEDCSLREWLNYEFYDAAFSSSEKARIVTAYNENPDSFEIFNNGGEGGNDTDDNVFLMSWEEAADYFGGEKFKENSSLTCHLTAYAKSHGYYVADSNNCQWWLRSPGGYQYLAVCVNDEGALTDEYVNTDQCGVRPAILID